MAVNVVVEDDAVEVSITGWLDRALCLSSGVRIPMADVVGARLAPFAEVRAEMGWRVGGAYVPGLVATGWYTMRGRKGARQLWAVRRDRAEVLVIDTLLDQPCRIVVAHPDRERLAWWINERVHPTA